MACPPRTLLLHFWVPARPSPSTVSSQQPQSLPHLSVTSSSRVQAPCHLRVVLPAPVTLCSLFLCPLGQKPRRTGTAVTPLPSASRSPAQGLQADGTERVPPAQPKAPAASDPSQGQRVECQPHHHIHGGHSESPQGGTGAEGQRWEQLRGPPAAAPRPRARA